LSASLDLTPYANLPIYLRLRRFTKGVVLFREPVSLAHETKLHPLRAAQRVNLEFSIVYENKSFSPFFSQPRVAEEEASFFTRTNENREILLFRSPNQEK
jgi:hypothetical protein